MIDRKQQIQFTIIPEQKILDFDYSFTGSMSHQETVSFIKICNRFKSKDGVTLADILNVQL